MLNAGFAKKHTTNKPPLSPSHTHQHTHAFGARATMPYVALLLAGAGVTRSVAFSPKGERGRAGRAGPATAPYMCGATAAFEPERGGEKKRRGERGRRRERGRAKVTEERENSERVAQEGETRRTHTRPRPRRIPAFTALPAPLLCTPLAFESLLPFLIQRSPSLSASPLPCPPPLFITPPPPPVRLCALGDCGQS